VIGDVQGVFYRFSAKQQADKLNITGFARNEPDDSVLIVAEGDDEALESLVMWAREGSPMAEVDNVETHEDKYTGEFKDFEVR